MQKKEMTVTVFIADDGTKFDSEYECSKYEICCRLEDALYLRDIGAEEVVDYIIANLADFATLSEVKGETQ